MSAAKQECPPPPALPAKRRRLNGKTAQALAPPSVPACSLTPTSATQPLRTLVINLTRRPDRWESIQKRLAPLTKDPKARAGAGAGQLRLAIERFAACDGKAEDIPEDVVSRNWTTDRNAKYDGRPGYRPGVTLEMTAGERGCAMSHVRAWKEVARTVGTVEGHRPVLILEDDAVFAARFPSRLTRALTLLPENVDALYLGYISGAPWRSKVAAGLYEAEYLWTTVGYLLWPRGARKLLDALPVDEPVDNFMAWQMSIGNFRALAVSPELIDQEQEWDCGSDVPHSDDSVLSI